MILSRVIRPGLAEHHPCTLHSSQQDMRFPSFSPQRAPLPHGAEGKPIPNELRPDEARLRKEVELEDDNTAVQRTHMDDE